MLARGLLKSESIFIVGLVGARSWIALFAPKDPDRGGVEYRTEHFVSCKDEIQVLVCHLQVALPIQWQRTRVWPLPQFFHLISAATGTGNSTAIFALNFSAPALVFLRDCQAGTGMTTACVLPAAALFEIASAAVHMLLDGQPVQPIQLADCAVQSALTLPNLAGSTQDPHLCTVDAATGAARISSGGASHFTAQAAKRAVGLATNKASESTTGVISRLLQHVPTAQRLSAANAVATVCHPPLQPTSGVLTHPAATEAATLLQAAVGSARAPHTAAVSCQAYVASCAPQLPHGFSVSAAVDGVFPASKRRSAVDISCRQAEAATPAAAFSGLVMASRKLQGSSRAADSPAMRLMWQPIASEPAVPIQPLPQKWLILSSQPCVLQDLCRDAEGSVVALNIVYSKESDKEAAQGTADIVVSCYVELQLLLAKAQADHCFLVQQRPDQDAGAEVAAESLAESASMLWAFRAFRRAQPRTKLSLVTWGTLTVGPYEAHAKPESLMALGMLHSPLAHSYKYAYTGLYYLVLLDTAAYNFLSRRD